MVKTRSLDYSNNPGSPNPSAHISAEGQNPDISNSEQKYYHANSFRVSERLTTRKSDNERIDENDFSRFS